MARGKGNEMKVTHKFTIRLTDSEHKDLELYSVLLGVDKKDVLLMGLEYLKDDIGQMKSSDILEMRHDIADIQF